MARQASAEAVGAGVTVALLRAGEGAGADVTGVNDAGLGGAGVVGALHPARARLVSELMTRIVVFMRSSVPDVAMSHSGRHRRLMGMDEMIVIGAGYAGVLAANRAAARGLAVTVVSERDALVDRIRLHEVVAGVRAPEDAAVPLGAALRGPDAVVARGVGVGEDAGRAWVDLDDGRRLEAAHVVLATGSDAGPGGWTWALTHRGRVAALGPGGRVLVRGAGLTGIETAAEIAEARPDLQVTLADPVGVGAAFPAPGRARLLASLRRLGVHVAPGGQDGVADLSIDCTGFARDGLAERSGLSVDASGAVEVDEYLRVRGRRRMWACGDAARVPTQPHLRMACATAVPMGALVADNVVATLRGESVRPLSLGYAAWALSLGRRDGLIQFVGRDDRPREAVWSGRLAAVGKQFVSRYAAWTPVRWARFVRGLGGPA